MIIKLVRKILKFVYVDDKDDVIPLLNNLTLLELRKNARNSLSGCADQTCHVALSRSRIEHRSCFQALVADSKVKQKFVCTVRSINGTYVQ